MTGKSPPASALNARIIRTCVLGLLLCLAIALFGRARKPVRERIMPPLDDLQAHEEIVERLTGDDARAYMDFVTFLRENQNMLSTIEFWSSIDGPPRRSIRDVTVEQAIFISRQAGIASPPVDAGKE